MRVLCLGVESFLSFSTSGPASDQAPTIYDYDIVFIDASKIEISNFYEKQDEFSRFFLNKGLCYVFLSPNLASYVGGDYRYVYSFLPQDARPNLESTPGSSIIWEDSDVEEIARDFTVTWNCFLHKPPEDYKVLARNRVGDIISYIVPISNGYCIFLPSFNDEDKHLIIDLLIDQGNKFIPDSETITQIPEWMNNYSTERERSLLQEKDEIEIKIGRVGKLKPLLYETGKKLEKVIMRVFRDLGFNVNKLPAGSYADFELILPESQIVLCEVKGVKEAANLTDLRQLLQYYIEQRDIESRKVFGVFIVNHYRDIIPTERGDPLTQAASELIEKHNFKVITTLEIYRYLADDFNKKITHVQFYDTFFS